MLLTYSVPVACASESIWDADALDGCVVTFFMSMFLPFVVLDADNDTFMVVIIAFVDIELVFHSNDG